MLKKHGARSPDKFFRRRAGVVLWSAMEGCRKYTATREEMLRMKHEFRAENKETLQTIKFFALLRHKRAGIAS